MFQRLALGVWACPSSTRVATMRSRSVLFIARWIWASRSSIPRICMVRLRTKSWWARPSAIVEPQLCSRRSSETYAMRPERTWECTAAGYVRQWLRCVLKRLGIDVSPSTINIVSM